MAKTKVTEEEKCLGRIYETLNNLMNPLNKVVESGVFSYGHGFYNESDELLKTIKTTRKELDIIKFELTKYNLDYDVGLYTTLISKFDKVLEAITEYKQKCTDGNYNISVHAASFLNRQYNSLYSLLSLIKQNINVQHLAKLNKAKHQNIQEPKIYDLLPAQFTYALNSNIEPYCEIYSVENFIRLYIDIKYFEKYGDHDLVELFKYATEARKKADSRKSKDEKQIWKTPRGATIVFYVDFDELASLIINAQNWDLFKDDFKDRDFIKFRISEIYDLRNKVAHNSMLSKEEIDHVKMLSGQIYNQLAKYKEKIKNWSI